VNCANHRFCQRSISPAFLRAFKGRCFHCETTFRTNLVICDILSGMICSDCGLKQQAFCMFPKCNHMVCLDCFRKIHYGAHYEPVSNLVVHEKNEECEHPAHEHDEEDWPMYSPCPVCPPWCMFNH
jgi:hypothetical protein